MKKTEQKAIKPYEPMGYLITSDREPEYYALPMRVIEQIMEMKNVQRDKRPQIVDLRERGYGRESLSKIRKAIEIDSPERGEVEHYRLQQLPDKRRIITEFIKSRKEQ